MKTRSILFYIIPLLVVAFCSSHLNCEAKTDDPELPRQKKEFKIVGYLFSHGDLDSASAQLDFSKITHLNVAFINPDSSGQFKTPQGLSTVVKRAHKKNVKVLMSIGGGSPPAYLKEMLVPEKRALLVNGLVDFADKLKLDGIDVDLEGDFIDTNYDAFVAELSGKLKPSGKLLTAAVATWSGDRISDQTLALYDIINIMSYDQTGPWNKAKAGPHSTYEAALTDFDYWNVTRKIPSKVLCLGLPFYGYGFGPDIVESLDYKSIVSLYPGSEVNDIVDLPGKGTIYYNGLPTIQKKLKFAVDKNAGGVMIWHLNGDAQKEKSLLLAIQAFK
jgi:chitinase